MVTLYTNLGEEAVVRIIIMKIIIIVIIRQLY